MTSQSLLTIFLIILYFSSINSEFNKQVSDDDDEFEDEEVYRAIIETPNIKQDPIDDVKSKMEDLKMNMIDLGYDFAKSLKLIYNNYTSTEIAVNDLDVLVKKSIINENQAIMIWETLLNTKTERNYDWWGYNKIIQMKKKLSIWSFIEIEFDQTFIILLISGLIFYPLFLILRNYPKVTLNVSILFMILFIRYAILYYDRKHYLTQFICFLLFIINIYLTFRSVILIMGKADIDYCPFYTSVFKSDEHFYMKILINSLLLLITGYFSLNCLRYYLNYLIFFFLINNLYTLITNYFHLNIKEELQPFKNFLSFIFSVVYFIFSQFFYLSNISFGYDLHSFIFMSNTLSFYYLLGINIYLKIFSYDLGRIYKESLNLIKNKELLPEESIENESSLFINRKSRIYGVEKKSYLWGFLVLFTFLFAYIGSFFHFYFFMLVSLYLFKLVNNYVLVFFNMKFSRIISSLFLIFFFVIFSKIESNNDYFLNEIFMIYDKKFTMALKLSLKLVFLVFLFFSTYHTEEFIDYFRIENYLPYIIDRSSSYEKGHEENLHIEFYLYEIFVEKSQGEDVIIGKFDYIYMIFDYVTIISNLWLISYIFSLNKNVIFFFVYGIHRIFLIIKLFLLYFEYNSTTSEKLSMIIINLLYSLRMINVVNVDIIDRFLFTILIFISFLIYFFLSDDNLFIQTFLLLYSITFIENMNSIIIFSFVIGVYASKIISKQSNMPKLFLLIITQFICVVIFSIISLDNVLYFIKIFKDLIQSIANFNIFDNFAEITTKPSNFEIDLVANFYNFIEKLI